MKFDEFINSLSPTNATLDYFVDFDKVSTNVSKIELKLTQLNYLLGKEDIKTAIAQLFDENPKCFSVLNTIIAVRENKDIIDDDGCIKSLDSFFGNAEDIYKFISNTGLEEVFRQHRISNLVDYVFGVEVGLDTNARKNRGGTNMEKAVSNLFLTNRIPFDREVKHTEYKSLTSLGVDTKQFDFVIETPGKIYLIETNFYNSGGSKLNEVARAYSELAPKINKYKTFEFVWITDGKGWLTAKNKIEEAFTIIPKIYNLSTIQQFIDLIKDKL